MNTFKIGDFVGSLATGSANRELVEVLVLLAGGAIDTAASSDEARVYVFSLRYRDDSHRRHWRWHRGRHDRLCAD